MPFLHYEYFDDYKKMSTIISKVRNLPDQGKDPRVSGNRPTYTKMARRYLSFETLNAFRMDYEIDKTNPEYIMVKRWVPEYEQDFLFEHSRELRERRRAYENRVLVKVEPVTSKSRRKETQPKGDSKEKLISKAKRRLKSAARALRDAPRDSDSDLSDIYISDSDIDARQTFDESSTPHEESHDDIKKIRFGSKRLAAALQDFKERVRSSTEKREGLKEEGKHVATVDPVYSTEDRSGTGELKLILRRAMTDLEETIDSTPNRDQKGSKDETFDVDKPKVNRSTSASASWTGAESEGKREGPLTHHKSVDPTVLDGTPRAQVEDNTHPLHLSAENLTPLPSSSTPNNPSKPIHGPSGSNLTQLVDEEGKDGIRATKSITSIASGEPRAKTETDTPSITKTKETDKVPRQINAPPAAQITADFLNENLITGYLPPIDGKFPVLQPRRTLDQYFYTHLESTSNRDGDQVVYRYNRKLGIRPKIFMVDQLWLWILNEGKSFVASPNPDP